MARHCHRLIKCLICYAACKIYCIIRGMSKIREKALRIFAQAKEMPGYSLSWERHSLNVAKITESITRAIIENGGSLNFTKLADEYPRVDEVLSDEEMMDMAFSAGLLHDIGRCVEIKVGLRHPILGYNLLMREGLSELAQVSMTHTYYGYKQIERAEFWEELDPESLDFTQDYMKVAEISDLDLLVQLADNMGHAMGVMTISDRFSDILIRHGIRSAGDHLRELFRIKQYFDKKAGINIYELFREEIIRTTMMEPNGVMREKQNVTDETEESL